MSALVQLNKSAGPFAEKNENSRRHLEDLTRTGMHGRLMVNLGWKYRPGLPDVSKSLGARLVNGGCPCLADATAGVA